MTRQESLCLTALVEAVAQDYADILANQAHQRKGIQTMKNPPLLFLDIECLGLDVEAPIWDLGAILLNGRNEVHPGEKHRCPDLAQPDRGRPRL
jgi:hypothetical protein